MKVRTETRRAAEAIGIQLRWAVIAAGALLMVDHLSAMVSVAVVSVWVISNLVAHKLCREDSLFERRGRPLMEAIRLIDGLAISGASFFKPFAYANMWLLGIPILIGEGLVTRDRNRVFRQAALIFIVQAAGHLLLRLPLVGLLLPAGVLALGSVVAIVLAGYKTREEMLANRDQRLATVLQCGGALAASTDLKATIFHTLKAAVIDTGATCGYVMLVGEDDKTMLWAESAYGVDGEFSFPERIEIGRGMSGYVAKMGQPISISDSGDEKQDYDGVTAGVRAAASVPLITRTHKGAGQATNEEVLGVMTFLSMNKGDVYDSEDLELLRTLGSLLAVAVSNARMEQRQRTTFLRTLQSLATALEARDEYTKGHSQRVCDVSMMIGEQLGFGQEALEELRVGTILHDIGKIGVPDEILNKRGRLTDEEFVVMKSHPVKGYEICRPLMLSDGVLMIIRNHHEKLDGSGYPDGLRGGELPLSLRIVCVADAFDAMSSRRPYRNVMEIQAVQAELAKGAGIQFDPVVVEALKELLTTERMYELYKQYWASRELEAA